MARDKAGDNGGPPDDATIRDWYRRALVTKIAIEAKAAELKTATANHRNLMKAAKKAGVPTEAISHSLAVRFDDPDGLVLTERARLKVMDLSGIVPGIRAKVLDRLDIEEPTRKDVAATELANAYDAGCHAGITMMPRDTNTYPAGSETFDAWDRGWLFIDQQTKFANEMAEGRLPEPPPQTTKGRAAKLHAEVTEAGS